MALDSTGISDAISRDLLYIQIIDCFCTKSLRWRCTLYHDLVRHPDLGILLLLVYCHDQSFENILAPGIKYF